MKVLENSSKFDTLRPWQQWLKPYVRIDAV